MAVVRTFLRPSIAVACAALLAGATASRASTAPRACAGAEYRQFDFFAGDWDSYDVSDSTTIVARNHVSRMLDGCAIREVYEQSDGLRGESFSTYDATRGRWHQSWVTNRGTLLLLDGGLVDGRMVLTADERAADGSTSLLRGVWWTEGTSVRERADRSKDGGKTWTTAFDIVFRPHSARAH
jgi:hypothetical protein